MANLFIKQSLFFLFLEDKHPRNNNQKTPRDLAKQKGHVELFRLFEKRGRKDYDDKKVKKKRRIMGE